MEYYIYNVPIFLVGTRQPVVDIPEFCISAEETLPKRLYRNVDVVYLGDVRELQDRNAMYSNGAIYMTDREPTIEDMIENLVHEVAHSLEATYGQMIYNSQLIQEFKGKRERLYHLLKAQGYETSPLLFNYTEYNKKFDSFLADEVGYPTLLTLTMGLFASPYGATSIQEYFANGFEKYFLDSPQTVRDVSPALYQVIEEIISDK